MNLIFQGALFLVVKILQAFAISFLLIILLKKEIKIDKKTALFTSIVLLIVLISSLATKFPSDLRIIASILTLAMYYLACKIIYKETRFACLTAVLLSFVIGGLAESLVIFIATNFFDFTFEDIVNLSYSKIICTFFANVFIFIGGYLINTFIIKKLTASYISENNNSFFYTLIFVVILFLPQILHLMENNYSGNMLFKISSIMQLLIIIIISLQKVKISCMQQKIKQDLENEKMYNKTLNTMVETVRGFKHDANNIINTVNGYITLDDMDGLKNYFNKGILKSSYKLKSIEQLSPKLLNDSGIYHLLATKYFYCTNNNIHLTLDISTDIESLDIPKFELSRILGILLDNAIEATEELDKPDKEIIFRLYKNAMTGIATIKIENEFVNDKDISVAKVYLKDFSTKKNPSGFGLYEVKKTVKALNNVSIQTNIEENVFKQKLIIKDKK